MIAARATSGSLWFVRLRKSDSASGELMPEMISRSFEGEAFGFFKRAIPFAIAFESLSLILRARELLPDWMSKRASSSGIIESGVRASETDFVKDA